MLVATGTGAGPVCDALGTHLAVLPQVLTWFPIADHELLARQEQQVFIRSSREAQFYGFPSTDGWTMKVAASVYLDEVASMARPVTWDPRHLDTVQSWVGRFLPALVPRPVRAVLCADGYTVDETGLLGFVPGLDGVVVAVGFSGHGFKMSSSLGAVAADLIADGTTATDISFMNPGALPAAGTVPRRPPAGRFLSRGALMTEIPPYVLGDLTAQPGSQVRGYCVVGLGTSTVSLPVAITHGAEPGPVLGVTAGHPRRGVRAHGGGPAVRPRAGPGPDARHRGGLPPVQPGRLPAAGRVRQSARRPEPQPDLPRRPARRPDRAPGRLAVREPADPRRLLRRLPLR